MHYATRFLDIKLKIIFALTVITVLLGVVYYLLIHYTVKNVIVEGNKHYSAKQIEDFVIRGYLGDNSLYLSLKYKNHSIEDIPFIEKMDVRVLTEDSIKITVYEKALAGYIEYLGRYMYFDHDGVLVEISKSKASGIPEVCGIDFNYAVLYQPLPVENQKIFQDILNLTKLLNKYDVNCERIFFDSDYSVRLYYGNVKVDIGKLEKLDEKIMQLPLILPELYGKKGTLDMINYSVENTDITFKKE